MVHERKDYYQLKMVVGEDPVSEAELVAVDDLIGALVEPTSKRKKKKAKRSCSTTEVEIEWRRTLGFRRLLDLLGRR